MPRTAFRPQIDGFAFYNSWTFDQAETDSINHILSAAIAGLAFTVAPMVAPFPDPFTIAIVATVLAPKIAGLIQGAIPQTYGLCGGMAWSALDYYRAGWVVPRGAGPGDQPQGLPQGSPASVALRNYIWQRLLDSDQSGGAAAMTLEWMAILQFVPGGAEILRGRSNNEWIKLKAHIDLGQPWPIGLIGTTANPTNNHQVLATGYDDWGDGTGALYLYDNNHPDEETVIALDFRNGHNFAAESGSDQGFMLFAYGNDEHLYRNYWGYDKVQKINTWIWEDLGAPPNSNVYTAAAAIAYQDPLTQIRRICAFAGDGSGQVWINSFDGSVWHWTNEGKPPNTFMDAVGLAAIAYADGTTQRMLAFVRGNDNHLYALYWNVGQWDWADQGTPPSGQLSSRDLMSTPSAITYRDKGVQRIDVFVATDSGHLCANWWDGAQWQWSDQGAAMSTSAGACAAITFFDPVIGAQKTYVFVLGGDRQLYVNFWDGFSWRWAAEGNPPNVPFASGLTATTYQAGGQQKVDVFGTGVDGHLYQYNWDGTKWSWTDLQTPPNTTLSLVVPATAITNRNTMGIQATWVYVRAMDFHVWLCYFDGTNWGWFDQGLGPAQGLVGGMNAITFTDHGNASAGRGPLQGFFCENYSFSTPPVAVGISQGLSVTPNGPANDGDTLQFNLEATNYGFSSSPPMALFVAGRPLANLAEHADAGGEANLVSINAGQQRALAQPDLLQGTTGARRFIAACHLGVYDGVDVWRSLPAVEPNTNSFVDMQIN